MVMLVVLVNLDVLFHEMSTSIRWNINRAKLRCRDQSFSLDNCH